jgi:hypothetical protein
VAVRRTWILGVSWHMALGRRGSATTSAWREVDVAASMARSSLGMWWLGLGGLAGACGPRPRWEWRGVTKVAAAGLSAGDAAGLRGVEEPAGPCGRLGSEKKLGLKGEKKKWAESRRQTGAC